MTEPDHGLLHSVEHPKGKKGKHDRLIIIGAAVGGLLLTYLMYRESKAAAANQAVAQPTQLPADASGGGSGGGTPNSVDLSGLTDALNAMGSQIQTNVGAIANTQAVGTSAVTQDSLGNGGVPAFQGRVDTVLQNWAADVKAGRPPSANEVSQFEQHVNTVVAGLTPTEAASLAGAGGAEGFQSRADRVLNNFVGDASPVYKAPTKPAPPAASTVHKKVAAKK